MSFYPTWFFCSWAIGALGVWIARQVALQNNWLDHPNARSFHDKPTPRIGGIGMLLPVPAAFVLIFLIPGRSLLNPWIPVLLPALLVALLSYVDDRIQLSRAIRFAGHLACGGILLWLFKDLWTGEPLPVFGTSLPPFLVAILLLLWVAGMTNAYNFMDGIDGMAALQGVVALLGWLTVLLFESDPTRNLPFVQIVLVIALTGGLLGFLLLNWAPASIFMGDVGSTFLGFYFASLPFGASLLGLPFERALEAGVFFVWPFIADTGMTFTRRLVRREKVFEAHRTHLYQVLASTFGTREEGHRITSLLYGLLGMIGIGLYWTEGPLWAKLAVLAWIWLAVGVWTYGIRLQKTKGKSASTEFSSSTDYSKREQSLTGQMPFEIYLSPPEITEAERRRVLEAFASGFIAPVGPQINAFEEALAAYLGMDELQAVSSGTAAIHLALRALGVGPGDCVLCPDLTFIASVNPVRYLGAEPVLVDVSPDNWAIDPELARKAIRELKAEGRTVRVMVVVHALGVPADIGKLMDIAREEGVRVLEDCAGAFGSRVGDQSVGLFGDAAAFSFNGNKVLTTSGGGALYLKDPGKRLEARSWANQGKAPNAIGYTHDTLGYNYKLSNICAAIGLGQIETVSGRLARKKGTFDRYKEQLSGTGAVTFLPEPVYGKNNYWLTCIGVDSPEHSEEIVDSLREQGIEAAPMWKPMHMQGLNKDLRVYGGEASERIYRTHLSLPSGSSLRPEQVDRICRLVKEQLAALQS